MNSNKKSAKKVAIFKNVPLVLTLCTAIALILGLVIGLLIPTPGSNIPSTPLSSVKVEDLTVNTVSPEDPVTLRFKLNGLPKGTELTVMTKHDGSTKYLNCTSDGSYYGCTISELNEDPTHVTLVLVHEGASVYLPLVRNLIQASGSTGYLGVWDYQ